MKTSLKYILLILVLYFSVLGCQKNFLNRPPEDEVDLNDFFGNAQDMKLAVHDLYKILPGEDVYIEDAIASDNVVSKGDHPRLTGSRTVPTSRGSGDWSWDNLRSINFVVQNCREAKISDENARKKYLGIARFFRAYFYYDKLKKFGAVPWYGRVLKVDDESLYKPRDSREYVIDSILSDIDFAINNIPAEKKLFQITKYTALILKARICLFEGTFRKYHKAGSFNEILEEAVSASKALIDSKAYTLYQQGGKDEAYQMLFARNKQDETETILAAGYSPTLKKHSWGYKLTSPTGPYASQGIAKDLINSYLMSDGTPFTDIPHFETMGYYEEMQDRDPRLTQTTAGPNFVPLGTDQPAPVNFDIAMTGYRVIKALPSKDQWGSSGAYNDVIIFRYAEALLIYAEAKAELGTLTQNDLDISLNKLRDRVGMPHLNLAFANGHPDHYQDSLNLFSVKGPNKGLILEIIRERRIELFNEGQRWDDLMRRKLGKKIEDQPVLGVYFPGLGAYDLNNDGKPDVYVYKGDDSGAPSGVTTKININEKPLKDPITGKIGNSGNIVGFNEGKFVEPRDYFYPIPKEDIELNESLEQNPDW